MEMTAVEVFICFCKLGPVSFGLVFLKCIKKHFPIQRQIPHGIY